MSYIQNNLTAASSGQGWTASTANTTLALNNYLRFVVSNPTGSGKTLYIYNISIYSSNVGQSNLKLVRNPATTVTANTVTPLNQHLYDGIFTTVANVAYDTNSSDLAGVVQKYLPALTNAENDFNNELYTVSAGWSLGISSKALLATNTVISVDWIEM